jgi:hypothetical protein
MATASVKVMSAVAISIKTFVSLLREAFRNNWACHRIINIAGNVEVISQTEGGNTIVLRAEFSPPSVTSWL